MSLLCLVIFLVLKYTVLILIKAINIAFPVLAMFTVYFVLCPFISWYVFLCFVFKVGFLYTAYSWLFFKKQSEKTVLLIWMFSPFTFSAVNGIVELRFIFTLYFYLSFIFVAIVLLLFLYSFQFSLGLTKIYIIPF